MTTPPSPGVPHWLFYSILFNHNIYFDHFNHYIDLRALSRGAIKPNIFFFFKKRHNRFYSDKNINNLNWLWTNISRWPYRPYDLITGRLTIQDINVWWRCLSFSIIDSSCECAIHRKYPRTIYIFFLDI